MKQYLEFDESSGQSPDVTYSQLLPKIEAFKIEQHINSLQLHRVAASISKVLREAFLTWGHGDLTDEQMAALTAILHSQYGLVGYTPPIPTPFALVDGIDQTAGISYGASLPTNAAAIALLQDQINAPGQYSSWGYVDNPQGTGNVFTPLVSTADGPLLLNIMHYIAEIGTLTIPKGTSLKIKDGVATETPILRTNDIVLNTNGEYSSTYMRAWVTADGKLYLCELIGDTVFPNVAYRSYDEAAQYPAL